MSVESYATLLNLKLVYPSHQSNLVVVDRAFWAETLGCRIAEIALDEAWYRQRYPDVDEAIATGLLPDARQHYRESGYFEHRLPYPIAVDAPWYLSQYTDVGAALSRKLYASAQAHFEEVGFKEGRLPYPGFSLGRQAEAG